MSNSVRPHRWQPTRLPRPWDSPGKNTGVGCHFLLQRMKVKSESEVFQSCLTLSDPMDCRLPGSSIHGIFQATVLQWGAIAFSEYLPHWKIITKTMFKDLFRTSLEVQWLKSLLSMQGTSVQSLVQVDSPCCRATKPVCHNKRSHCNEKPAHHN